MLIPADGNDAEQRDTSLDSSLFGLHLFGVLPADDPRLSATLDAVVSGLAVRTDIGGIARYRGDGYYAQSGDLDQVPGNPWFIVQCWYAMWRIARASSADQLDAALEPLEWAARRATPSRLLPEQIHPFSGNPLAVTPLIWSHASFVTAIHAYLARSNDLREKTSGLRSERGAASDASGRAGAV
jgi:GH15 family glucan-1,4-alpha-glucosidase